MTLHLARSAFHGYLQVHFDFPMACNERKDLAVLRSRGVDRIVPSLFSSYICYTITSILLTRAELRSI